MDHFDHERHTTFKFLEEAFHASNESSQFEIKLHFFFKSQTKHYILNQGRPQCLLHSIPHITGATSAAVASPRHVAEAVGEAAGDRLLDGERGELTELVRGQVSRHFPAAGTGGVLLFFAVSVERRHVYAFGGGGPRVAPAADVAFGRLEEYEVGRARADVAAAEEEEERCCSICLEELGGSGGAARMPCKHVFHGGCIKKWLRKSHYCPLCRYEMPTE